MTCVTPQMLLLVKDITEYFTTIILNEIDIIYSYKNSSIHKPCFCTFSPNFLHIISGHYRSLLVIPRPFGPKQRKMHECDKLTHLVY